MSLAAQQAAFRVWLEQGDETENGSAIAQALVDPCGLSVYQNNYRGQLMACLAEAFPQTLAWLGDEAFAAAAARHIDAHPPKSFTLDAYPGGLVESLRHMWPGDPEVAELAALEWQLAEAFVAADDRPLTPADLPRLDWERTSLRLVASARIMRFASNAPQIWSALAGDVAPPAARIAAQRASFVVWRADFVCCFRQVQGAEAALLESLAQPRGFTDMCEELAREHGPDEAIGMVGELLARWLADRLVVAEPG